MVSQLVISGLNLARRCPKAVAAAKKILCQKPQGIGLRYARALEGDVTQFSSRNLGQIKKKADDILKEVKRNLGVDLCSQDAVENYRKGILNTCEDMTYKIYKIAEAICNESPEAFILFREKARYGTEYTRMLKVRCDTLHQITKEMPVDQIKNTFTEVDTFLKNNNYKPELAHYINMLIIKHYNPKIYKFYKTTANMAERGTINGLVSGDYDICSSVLMLKNITPEQIKVMAHDSLPLETRIGEYVECSDAFIRNKEAVKNLSEDLSKCRLSTNVELYRGDKTVGMFDSIAIDKDFESHIRQLLEHHKENAKSMKITRYSGKYLEAPGTNLYDFLSQKETLTLADAMQVVKFGDEEFLNEVIRRIQNSKIIDSRFKSFSFDEGMAAGWRKKHSGANTTIIHKAIVKQGTQGGYHATGTNGQYEVILNNAPKEMSFQNVVYNKETDTFELSTIIQNI